MQTDAYISCHNQLQLKYILKKLTFYIKEALVSWIHLFDTIFYVAGFKENSYYYNFHVINVLIILPLVSLFSISKSVILFWNTLQLIKWNNMDPIFMCRNKLLSLAIGAHSLQDALTLTKPQSILPGAITKHFDSSGTRLSYVHLW